MKGGKNIMPIGTYCVNEDWVRKAFGTMDDISYSVQQTIEITESVIAKAMGTSVSDVHVSIPKNWGVSGTPLLVVNGLDKPERLENADDRALAIYCGLWWLFEDLTPHVDIMLGPMGVWNYGDPERAKKLLE